MSKKTKRGKPHGKSDYHKYKMQPYDIWLEYDLDPWQADIIKRVLRTKEGDAPELDYLKIIDVCHEIIRQIEGGNGRWNKGYGMGATCEH